MIRKITISAFAIATMLLTINAINKPSSSGAPSASTGAPGEQTCAMSTCHDSYNLNSGKGKLSVEIGKIGEGGAKGFPIKIKMAEAGKIRFGFQVTALDDANNKIGEFMITDSVRTQMVGEKVGLENRNYLTYTYYGTLDNDGEAEWTANWVPTENKPGKVTFYVAAVSADNNGDDDGDYVYTKTASTSWETTASTKTIIPSEINISVSKSGLRILNPHKTYINSVSLTDIGGKIVFESTVKNAKAHTEITIPELKTGLIIAIIETSNGTITKKLFINQ